MELKLLTWNVNGSGPQGHANRRDFIVPHVYHHLQPDIAFFQELTVREDTRKKWQLLNHSQHTKKVHKVYQAGVACKGGLTTTINLTDDDVISKLVPDGETDQPESIMAADEKAGFPKWLSVDVYPGRMVMRSDIPSRVHAVKLPLEGGPENIVLVSFHSIHKGMKSEAKKRYISHFFNLMCRLAIREDCLVIIGGDFNLHVGDWKGDLELVREFHGRVKVAPFYKPTPRRDSRNVIDTFAVVFPTDHPQQITCRFHTPCGIFPFPWTYVDHKHRAIHYEGSDAEELQRHGLPPPPMNEAMFSLPHIETWQPILEKDLDHDPVEVTIVLQRQRKATNTP